MSYAVVTNSWRAAWAGDGTVLPYVQLAAGLSNQQAADLCGVSLRTYRRWRSSKDIPLSALRLLCCAGGYIPPQIKGWEDWEFQNGCLFPPGYTRNGIQPGDIMGLPFLWSLVPHLRNENAALRRLADKVPPDAHAQQGHQGELCALSPGAETESEAVAGEPAPGQRADGHRK